MSEKDDLKKLIEEIKTEIERILTEMEAYDFGDDEWMELKRASDRLKARLKRLKMEGA